MNLSRYNVRKKIFSNKNMLKECNVSIMESLTPKCIEIPKKVSSDHCFTNTWTCDGKILYKSSTENKVKLYYK